MVFVVGKGRGGLGLRGFDIFWGREERGGVEYRQIKY